MSLFDHVQRDIIEARSSEAAMQTALSEFQSACIVRDWRRTEMARARALGSLDAYLDHLAAAHKVMGDG